MPFSPRRACVVASLGCALAASAVAAAAEPVPPRATTRPSTQPTTRPSTLPATRPTTSPVVPVVAPATRPVAARPPTTLPASRPTTGPAAAAASATRPAGAPVRPVAGKPGAAEPLPTPDELKALFDDGKYADVLKQLRTILVLRGPAAEPYNKYEMLLLRADAHLHLKAQAAAVASLAEAAETTDDPQKIAYTKAVTLLLKRSKNFQYQPSPTKKEKPPAVDVIDGDSRRAALKALLADEMAVVAPKVEAALDGRTLAGIADALAAIQGLDVLELGVGGGDEARNMVTDLRTRGLALMAKTLQVMIGRTDEISRSANELLKVRVVAFDGVRNVERFELRKRGLENRDYAELKEVMKTADMIIPNAKGLIQATGGKAREVEDMITAAEDLKRKADKTLTADYSSKI